MKKQNNKKLKIYFAFLLSFAFSIFSFNFVMAIASFQVTSFSCSPSESVINSVFSCTAQIKNNGDAVGSVSTATLYPDAGNWLENSNYLQSSGTSVDPGQSIEITFTGLRAIKSGNNGFSKIMLDSVTDTYVADQNKKVNIIDVVVTLSNSDSSAAMGASITATSEVTAGGNIDVSLTFTSNSGGCSIGSQTNPKTISGMTDGSKQSRTWTITQGTSGNCRYTISAAATGSGGVASKIDSTTSTITCTNCPSGGGATTTSGGGGGGGGGASKVYTLGELITSQLVELSDNEQASFNISGKEHILTLKNHTETTAKITVQSEIQTFILTVGDMINVDLNQDNSLDISINLKSINIITGKVSLVLSPFSAEKGKAPITGGVIEGEGGEGIKLSPTAKKTLWFVIIFFIVLAIISAIIYIIEKRKRRLGGK